MTTSTADRLDSTDGPHHTDEPHHPKHLVEKAEEDTPSTPLSKIAVIAVGVTALIMLVLTAFAYPATHATPHNVPIAVVGPAAAVQQISVGLQQQAEEDGFDITPLADRESAVQAIEDREIYGALVLGPQGGEMLTASAASPAVAQILNAIAAGIPEQAGGPLDVVDVVALPEADERGSALGASLLPLIIAGIAGGVAISTLVRGARDQVGAALLTAIAVGLGVTIILSTWLSALPGPFLAIWCASSLSVASISVMILGWRHLIGPAGIMIGALLVMFVGNPFSGVTSAPELLPAGFGTFGQFLPPGAIGSLLRSVGYFDGAGSAMPIAVLVAWLLAGVAMVLLGARRENQNQPESAIANTAV